MNRRRPSAASSGKRARKGQGYDAATEDPSNDVEAEDEDDEDESADVVATPALDTSP